MKITEAGSEKLKKVYDVRIDASDIERATDEELKSLGSRVKIPGFRPGHVPMKVLKQRYGKSVHSDVLKNVVNDATQRAIENNKLRIALQPDVKVHDYTVGGDLTFTLTVETLPEIPDVDFGKIAIEREVYDLPEDEVDRVLGNLAARNPQPETLPEGTKAEQGHVVTMDFVGTVDGVAFEGGASEGFRVELGSGRLIDTFEDQLVGKKAGDAVTVKVTFPDNYFNKELSGKPAQFDVKVKEVAKLVVPEINEEFAKERGFADLRALKEAARNQVMKDYDSLVRSRLKKRLFDALEETVDFPLPEKMVQMEFDAIWNRLQQEKTQDADADIYEGKTEEQVKEDYRKIAGRRVRLGILLAEIGSKQKLQISRDEMTRALMEHARQFPGQEQAVFEFYRKNPNRLDELRGPLLEEKAVDYVLTKVKLTDRKVTTQELNEGPDYGAATQQSAGSDAKKATSAKKPAAKKKKADE